MNNPQPKARYRLMNPDGTLRILRAGSRSGTARDLYHSLLRYSWPSLILVLLGLYLVVNVLFAFGYMLCGQDALEGASKESSLHFLLDAFFFSVQTFATIGYGKMTPSGVAANLLVTLEALFGLLGVALSTGLLFARFSRPTARVIFSRVALITPHDGTPSLLFRVANERLNQIIEARIRLTLMKDEQTTEGERYRNIYDLKLERDLSPIFALSLTVVHPITPDSPLYGLSLEQLLDSQAELIASVTGTDDTFSQQIHARHSYNAEDIVWNRNFADMLTRSESGEVIIDLAKIHTLRDA